MEKTPFQPELDSMSACGLSASGSEREGSGGGAPRPMMIVTAGISTSEVVTTDWRRRLPVLSGEQVVLRELRRSDAESLFALLTTAEVARFISPPPTSVEGFEHFIDWTHRQRTNGSYVCFAVTVKGFDTAVGIFQVRQLGFGFDTAEWGFAIGSPFWGTGMFKDAAELVLEFAFDSLGVHRLEARAATRNGRGNGALLKIGAVQEAVLRRSFLCRGEYLDQALYSIVEDDWRAAREFQAHTDVRFGSARVH